MSKVIFVYNNGKTFTQRNVVDLTIIEQVKGIPTGVLVGVEEITEAKFVEQVPRDRGGITPLFAASVPAARAFSYTVNSKESGLLAVIIESGPQYGDATRGYKVIPFRTFVEGETPIKIEEVIEGLLWSQGLRTTYTARS
jgi:hypothetical protein